MLIKKTCFFVVPLNSNLTVKELLIIKKQVTEMRVTYVPKKGFYVYTLDEEQVTVLFKTLYQHFHKVLKFNFI